MYVPVIVLWLHYHIALRDDVKIIRDCYSYLTQHNKNEPLHDLNVMTVWSYNITGRGATVCVVDDGEYYCLTLCCV